MNRPRKYILIFIIAMVISFILSLAMIAKSYAVEISGEASYYSESGCLGCSKTLTMANGERLDDDLATVALTPPTVRNFKLLNKYVTIINEKTQRLVVAKVTDTGGFGKYNRVADLSVAVKEALGCSSLCRVVILF